MMQNCAIPFDDAKVSSYTVKSIVNDMRKHLGFEAWTVAPIENLNFELVDKVLEVIKASLVDIDDAIQKMLKLEKEEEEGHLWQTLKAAKIGQLHLIC